ncbi:methyl-accepting chemotaxis protein [Thaumasiovibrio subtropicus]|uniref:methyl-accepting chemotaxis protein n=1 Tax=Thaumasiovibrio subtropicus TaxID=1891207 RepID=UPI000B352DDA|nr:methyl-accepting chemotaxis protein [Thaumasiovibrio subtropicus]
MAKLTFKPWEKTVTDIKLVPKLVLLMVFSTILVLGKQLWDARTFHQSLLEIQLHTQQELAAANLATLQVLKNSNPEVIPSVIADTNLAYGEDMTVFLVDKASGDIQGHPTARSLQQLAAVTESGVSQSSRLRQVATDDSWWLGDGEVLEYAKLSQDGTYWIVVSQTSKEADAFYADYLVQVAWQTVAMILIFMVVLLGGSSIMLRQFRYLSNSIQQMSDRNLAEKIEMQCKDEFGELAQSLERTREQLRDVVLNQRTTSHELSEVTEVMTMSMQETREAAQEEFNEIDQLASAMSEMTSTVSTVAEHAKNASQATEGTSEQAKQGQQFVSQTVHTIEQLSNDITASAQAVNQVEERVERIGSVVTTIQSISEQTNLLALNAAIEAARAGEAGRGFAVVADEVRNLAGSTGDATIEIQEMITQLQQSAQEAVNLMEQSVVEAADGVELVTKAGMELDSIVHRVQEINDMNFHIASAAEQQSQVADEMNQNLTNVRELVEGSVTVVTELTETAEEMQNTAAEMENKIQAFNV